MIPFQTQAGSLIPSMLQLDHISPPSSAYCNIAGGANSSVSDDFIVQQIQSIQSMLQLSDPRRKLKPGQVASSWSRQIEMALVEQDLEK